MNSILDEVDGFDYSDESINNNLLGTNFTTQSNDLFYPSHSQSTTTSTTTTTQPSFTATANTAFTTSPMGVVLDDALFRGAATVNPTSFDWSSQSTGIAPAGIPSFFATLGMDGAAAATTATTTGGAINPIDLTGGVGALPPMPAMPTTVVSNEELESKIIQDSQAAAAAAASVGVKEEVTVPGEYQQEQEEQEQQQEEEEEEVVEEEEENVQQQQQPPQQQQQQPKVKLAELARANVGTNYGMPPFASFVRDVKNERCLKEKKRYMSREDINEMIDTHYKMLNSWTPYAEDFYRLNYFHSK